MTTTPPKCAFAICLALFPLVCVHAQNPPTQAKSLADVARDANKNKTVHAKTVYSDDNLAIARGPIPSLNFEGVDNSDEISAAIDTFRKSHSTKETEALVHAWYEKYYALFVGAFEENKTLTARQQDRYYDQENHNYNEDPRKYRQLRNAEARSARNDQKKVSQNGLMKARIQQAFSKVRSDLNRMDLRYVWFKIPFGNGNGSY